MKALEEDKSSISHLNSLISSLLDQIPHIPNLRAKCSVLTSKLSLLQSQLNDLSDFPSSSSNPLSLDLFRSISLTLHHSFSLSNSSQSHGKLQTQSLIDSLISNLIHHINDSQILISSGILHDDTAGSKNTSKKEVIRVKSRNLITRLQIGTADSKSSALDSLLRLLHEDDTHVMIAVAQGVVPVLVRLLDSSSLDVKEKTVAAISRVSMVDSNKDVLAAEGLLLLNNLLRILESGSGFAKEKACIALQALSFSKDNARAIGSTGGISSLVDICQAGTPCAQAFAAGVLRNLSQYADIKDNFIEENAVFVVLGLSASGTTLAQEYAIGCLSNLVRDDDNLKILVAKEGAIDCLKNFWDSAVLTRSLEVGVEFLMQLALCRSIAEVLVNDGFITRLVALISSSSVGLRVAAAQAIYELGYDTKTRKEIGECGCIPPMIKMLDAKASQEKEAAAIALSALMLYDANKRILRKDDRGIVSVVQLLDPSIQNLNKKYLVSILASIVHSKSCRKQMIAAGASLYLQKLVETDVEGAKKLLDCLGCGKIWGVFAKP